MMVETVTGRCEQPLGWIVQDVDQHGLTPLLSVTIIGDANWAQAPSVGDEVERAPSDGGKPMFRPKPSKPYNNQS